MQHKVLLPLKKLKLITRDSTCAVLLYQALQNSYPNLFFKWSYLFMLAIVRIQAILVSELLGKRDLKLCFDQVRIR